MSQEYGHRMPGGPHGSVKLSTGSLASSWEKVMWLFRLFTVYKFRMLDYF